MKKAYTNAEMKLIMLASNDDVITNSVITPGTGDGGKEPGLDEGGGTLI